MHSGATSRPGRRMVMLGKVTAPKPVNLPSKKHENHGLDPNVDIVHRTTSVWGNPNNHQDAAASDSASHATSEPSTPAIFPGPAAVKQHVTSHQPGLPSSFNHVAPAAAWGGAGMPEKRQALAGALSRGEYPSFSSEDDPHHHSQDGHMGQHAAPGQWHARAHAPGSGPGPHDPAHAAQHAQQEAVHVPHAAEQPPRTVWQPLPPPQPTGVWADTPVEPPRVQALLSAQPTAHQPPTSGNTPPGYVHTGVDRWVPPSVAHAMAHAQAHAPQHAPHVQTQSHGPIHGDRWQPSSSQQQQQEQERWLHPGPDRHPSDNARQPPSTQRLGALYPILDQPLHAAHPHVPNAQMQHDHHQHLQHPQFHQHPHHLQQQPQHQQQPLHLQQPQHEPAGAEQARAMHSDVAAVHDRAAAPDDSLPAGPRVVVPPTPNLHAESSRDQITPTKILRREHPEHSQPFGHPSQSPPNAPPAPIHSLQHVSQHVGAPPAHAAQHAQHATHAEQNSQDPIAPTGPGPVKFGQISPSSIRQQASQVLFSGMPAQMSEQSVSHSGQPGPIQQRVNYPAAYQQQLSQHEMSRHVPGQHGMAHHEPRQHGMAQHGVSQQNLTQPSVSHDRAVRPHILHRPAELQHAQQHGPSQAQQLHHGQQVLAQEADRQQQAADITTAEQQRAFMNQRVQQRKAQAQQKELEGKPAPKYPFPQQPQQPASSSQLLDAQPVEQLQPDPSMSSLGNEQAAVAAAGGSGRGGRARGDGRGRGRDRGRGRGAQVPHRLADGVFADAHSLPNGRHTEQIQHGPQPGHQHFEEQIYRPQVHQPQQLQPQQRPDHAEPGRDPRLLRNEQDPAHDHGRGQGSRGQGRSLSFGTMIADRASNQQMPQALQPGRGQRPRQDQHRQAVQREEAAQAAKAALSSASIAAIPSSLHTSQPQRKERQRAGPAKGEWMEDESEDEQALSQEIPAHLTERLRGPPTRLREGNVAVLDHLSQPRSVPHMQASMSAVGSWMSAHLEGPSDPSAAPNGLPQAASQPDRAADRDPRDHRGGADDDSRLRQARQQRGEQQRGKPAEGAEQQGSRRERRERGERGRRERVEGGEVVGERVRERAQRGEGDRRDRGDRRPRERRERAAQDVPAGSALQQSAQPSQQSQPADAAGLPKPSEQRREHRDRRAAQKSVAPAGDAADVAPVHAGAPHPGLQQQQQQPSSQDTASVEQPAAGQLHDRHKERERPRRHRSARKPAADPTDRAIAPPPGVALSATVQQQQEHDSSLTQPQDDSAPALQADGQTGHRRERRRGHREHRQEGDKGSRDEAAVSAPPGLPQSSDARQQDPAQAGASNADAAAGGEGVAKGQDGRREHRRRPPRFREGHRSNAVPPSAPGLPPAANPPPATIADAGSLPSTSQAPLGQQQDQTKRQPRQSATNSIPLPPGVTQPPQQSQGKPQRPHRERRVGGHQPVTEGGDGRQEQQQQQRRQEGRISGPPGIAVGAHRGQRDSSKPSAADTQAAVAAALAD